ncbi:transposase, partial [Algibacter agarivorans]|uniref:transposase n=1 Tax=Algibacter agarivorans TaxID=1109741 RepID=UPI0031EFAC3B
MPKRFYTTLATIRKVYTQQYMLFTTGEKPKGRIVSLSKSYLRPIVRGKEIKAVEFGAKVNKLQIDGVNFIQKISFDNFNEGTQFKNTIYKAQGLTKIKVDIAGADAIYATNKNRVFATSNKIQTDFKPKGKPSKHHKTQKKLKAMITKERASRLEGSFGKEKEHYHLKKIKAKTKTTEILWIFFGMHTANAL